MHATIPPWILMGALFCHSLVLRGLCVPREPLGISVGSDYLVEHN